MIAYYNENDEVAAATLRELIKAGAIAFGDVDTRSISDVHPNDLKPYTQCHFFAGIGGWPHALRLAGWPDTRRVWTGSCPCQPFSAAGEGRGTEDIRHLWPDFYWLILQCQPATVYGEQVASALGRDWLSAVRADLEALDYGVGAADLCAASVGAPHVRQRLYWVANAAGAGPQGGEPAGQRPDAQHPTTERGSEAGGLADAAAPGRGLVGRGAVTGEAHSGPHADLDHQEYRPRPTDGFWRAADWLQCRDGKWRPVEACPQPLVDGSAESLGRVRHEVITQIEEEVDAATAQSEGGRAAAMRALLAYLGAQAQRCWPLGGIPGLHEAPFLLAFLRQLQEQGWQIAEGVALPRSEASSGLLRSLWHQQAASGASCRRELAEQRPGEPADVVRVLSRLLARHSSTAWGDAHSAYAEIGFPLGHNAPARVGRLRGYGNAIVPQVAAAFIKASMT